MEDILEPLLEARMNVLSLRRLRCQRGHLSAEQLKRLRYGT